jgi:hypothetical protein
MRDMFYSQYQDWREIPFDEEKASYLLQKIYGEIAPELNGDILVKEVWYETGKGNYKRLDFIYLQEGIEKTISIRGVKRKDYIDYIAPM